MKLKEYTGSINETQDKGAGKGRELIWGGRRYYYVSICKKHFVSVNKLDLHEQNCSLCLDYYYAPGVQGF